MALRCVDNLDKFDFTDAKVVEFKSSADMITMTLTGVLAKYNNPANQMLDNRYIETSTTRLDAPVITKFFIEGQKNYDADGNLLNTIPDTDIPKVEYGSTFEKLAGGQFFILQTKPSKSDKPFCLEMCVDVGDESLDEDIVTYWLEIEFDRAITDWERFLNRKED